MRVNMKKLEELKIKYDSIIKESLATNQDILLESFIEYYGEEHRKAIVKNFSEITFAYYVDFPILDLVVDEYIPQTKNPEKYENFIQFRLAHQETEKGKKSLLSRFTRRLSRKGKLEQPENMVGITNEKVLEEEFIKNKLSRIFQNINPTHFNYGSANNMRRIVAFPLLITSDKSIIHEINHSITNNSLALVVDDNYKVTAAVTKVGLDVTSTNEHTEEKTVEELLNEKASLDITEIFHRRGGNLSSFCFDIPLINYYGDNLYLIDEFYSNFIDLLKIARITENKNLLVQKIGKENYQRLTQIVKSNYIETTEYTLKPNEEVQSELHELIVVMKKNASSSHEIEREDLQKYYQELREQGYTVYTNGRSNNR